jgi:tRNA/rRNA methyltransferase
MSGVRSADSPSAAFYADRMRFILVEPQNPANVGSAVRAMKNMGLRDLVVVNPAPSFDPERVRWLAPSCEDVVARMRIVATLDEALDGVQRAIATTGRHRRYHQPVWEPRALVQDFFEDPHQRTTAILFGREDNGLDNASISRCESLLRIPTPQHASLNLAQAVLLVGHDLFEAGRERGAEAFLQKVGGARGERTVADLMQRNPKDRPADLVTMEPAVADLVALFDRVGYLKGRSPDQAMMSLRQGLQGSGLTLRHLEALRGLVRRVDWALSNPDLDWRRGRGGSDDAE